jgi:hypothetical protein
MGMMAGFAAVNSKNGKKGARGPVLWSVRAMLYLRFKFPEASNRRVDVLFCRGATQPLRAYCNPAH